MEFTYKKCSFDADTVTAVTLLLGGYQEERRLYDKKMIKNKKDNKILKRVLSLCLVLMLAVTSVHLFFPVRAETIEHTHIWATKYDSTNHWEYCTVCGEKRNVIAHAFTDHWQYGYESCNSNNYSLRTCTCGFSYIYHKPHPSTRNPSNTTYYSDKRLHQHHQTCTSCGDWFGGSCVDTQGHALSCKYPGTCVYCGATYTANDHFLAGGVCRYCQKQFVSYSNLNVQYSDDYSTVTVSLKVTPLSDEVTSANAGWYSATPIGTWVSSLSVVDADGKSKIYTWTYNITNKSGKASSYYYVATNHIINGTRCQDEGSPNFTIHYDHVAPVQDDVIQEDQASANGWATIKQLTLSGTENASDTVYLTVFDKITGEKYVTDAAVSVTDGKYSYTCTPPIEADANGRTYVVTAKDRMGNVSTKEFVVYKTDGSAPALKAGTSLSYTDWTHTPKNISLSFYDFGAGGVQVSFDNQTSYQALTKNGEYYIWNKSFGNQVGTTGHKLYVKDALGNATVYTLTVGNVNTNAYTITYNLDGGTISGQKTMYTVEDTFTLPTPQKTGYTFLGYVGSNGTSAQKSVTVNKGTRGNLTYTAQWTPNSYIVTFDSNGGILHTSDTNSINVTDSAKAYCKVVFDKDDYNALCLSATKSGYIFTGFADSNGVKLWNGWGECLKDGKYYNNNKLWKYAGDVTVYAQYSPITYTLKYDANGGSGTMSNQKCTYDVSQALMSNTFKRDGYIFKGWNTKADGTGTAYSDKQSIENIADKDGTVVTLYAQWQINTYDLTVTHKVSGNMGNKHSDFSFTLNLSGMSGNSVTAVFTDVSGKQITKTLSMNNSKVAFTLKHGESIVFKDVPYNTPYTITENNADGYTVSSTNASGKVTSNTTATFTSTRNATVPTSADTNVKAMVIIVGLSIIAANMLILKRRKTKTE